MVLGEINTEVKVEIASEGGCPRKRPAHPLLIGLQFHERRTRYRHQHDIVIGKVDLHGIEPIGNGDFLVTSWPGYIFYVYADGQKELLLDTHEQKKNTADIGYDPVKKIIYVPGILAV